MIGFKLVFWTPRWLFTRRGWGGG